MAEDNGQLLVQELCRSFPTASGLRVVLRDVSFRLSPGESLAIMGPSGSGKSTLLNLLGGLDIPDSGRLLLGGLDLRELDEAGRAAYRNRTVGFVFQNHLLLPQCTALENVLLPALACGKAGELEARARQLLDAVGLGQRSGDMPATLSGGESQRVAIARSMLHQPGLFLCDEPTGNLDSASEEAIADIFLRLASQTGAMIIVATHNLRFARRFGRQAELVDGAMRM